MQANNHTAVLAFCSTWWGTTVRFLGTESGWGVCTNISVCAWNYSSCICAGVHARRTQTLIRSATLPVEPTQNPLSPLSWTRMAPFPWWSPIQQLALPPPLWVHSCAFNPLCDRFLCGGVVIDWSLLYSAILCFWHTHSCMGLQVNDSSVTQHFFLFFR